EAIAAERARIAHELHDVVTHHVTAMVVQAEAGQFRDEIDPQTRDLLASIAEGGRTTLVDLRSLLGALEGDAEISRSPAQQNVDDIVARARTAGQQVEFVERGERQTLTGARGLVLIRVVQESLTNAMKHARDGAASVAITYGEREILIEVVSSGRRSAASTPGGRGIIGMRERVEFVGGELQAEPSGERFIVRAKIPA
ncbi:MAG: sensor histidine kinase, partial [Pseudoclavibacter sp.]